MRTARRTRMLCLLLAVLTRSALCAGCGGQAVTQSAPQPAADGERHQLTANRWVRRTFYP